MRRASHQLTSLSSSNRAFLRHNFLHTSLRNIFGLATFRRTLTRALVASLLSITLPIAATNLAVAAGSDDPKTFLLPAFNGQNGANGVGVIFDDSQAALSYASGLGDTNINSNPDGTQASGAKLYCKNLQDPACSKTTNFSVFAILQPCKSESDLFCIQEVYAKTPNGKVTGKFVENLPAAGPTDFTGDSSLGLPTGGPPSIWQIPGIKNSSGGDSYTLFVSTRGKGQRASATSTPTFQFNEYTVALYATSSKSGSYQLVTADGNGLDAIVGGGCATNSESKCALRESFPTDGTAFGVSIRFPKAPSNWFYGRLSKPSFTLNKSNSGSSVVLDVSGEPVTVPVLFGKSSWGSLSPALQKYYQGGFPSVGKMYGVSDPNQWDVAHLASSKDFDVLKGWIPIVKDTAAALTTQWYFKASNEGSDPRFASRDDQVDGIVTSNATAYVPGPPTFNQQTQSLEYQVGAPHLTPSGATFRGTYDLTIRADAARAIYGFAKNVPVKATVSIVSENGQEIAAQEQVGEKDGWFFLRAENFTFSSPKLRVKLTQSAGGTNSGNNQGSNNQSGGNQNGNNQGNYADTVKCDGTGKCCDASGKCTTGNPVGNNNSGGSKNAAGVKTYVLKCSAKGGKTWVARGVNPKCPKGYKQVSKKLEK